MLKAFRYDTKGCGYRLLSVIITVLFLFSTPALWCEQSAENEEDDNILSEYEYRNDGYSIAGYVFAGIAAAGLILFFVDRQISDEGIGSMGYAGIGSAAGGAAGAIIFLTLGATIGQENNDESVSVVVQGAENPDNSDFTLIDTFFSDDLGSLIEGILYLKQGTDTFLNQDINQTRFVFSPVNEQKYIDGIVDCLLMEKEIGPTIRVSFEITTEEVILFKPYIEIGRGEHYRRIQGSVSQGKDLNDTVTTYLEFFVDAEEYYQSEDPVPLRLTLSDGTFLNLLIPSEMISLLLSGD